MDARIVRTRAAVVRTATELLVEGGPSAVTVDAVVARSGVAKSTVYRHWDSRDDLLLDVIRTNVPAIAPPDPALPFEPALRAFIAEVVDRLTDPHWTRLLPAMLMLKQHEPAVALIEGELREREAGAVADVIARGVAEGFLPDGLDPNEAITQLYGPLVFAQLTDVVELSPALGDRVVDWFLAARAR